MSAYAVGILNNVRVNDDIRKYLQEIDATLHPYQGRFIIHGDPCLLREGEFPGNLVVIQFPDLERASGWYASPAYCEIKSLRTANSDGIVFLVQGVPVDHVATDVLVAS